ncbi:TPA: CPBP family intramembrane metalloprotease [Staphylococcus aureus]|uniref:CPBP family intramembrane glutamic endopeptidase n=2 Tax=Staphylococcus aureus TaxID=1280 RepID=UPI00085CAF85|nr:CPBP family intramembrane glutamic endopeptidase [Staphylococcus aureus]URH52548.1 CPBP family intramembrane metalloprotease [Staphylococcus aureus]SCU18332.1 CAAX amino terminal protease family protein [Staphylococcus aureus]SCU22137.1 CAAX amino terminal protease family protein [Staphylococcus aureus]SCU37968.1 CAAX amino terminal protease family protein [Staphylococcus aureus]SCU45865.1 CAAX amino terminal protease family protein [Staphylococcus aureus]
MQRFKEVFQDDLSVTRENYFMSVVKAVVISLLLLISLELSSHHAFSSLFLLIIVSVIAKFAGFRLVTFKKLTLNHVVYIVCAFLLVIGLDTLYTHIFPVPTNQEELDMDIQNQTFLVSLLSIAVIPAIAEELIFRGFILTIMFRKHLFLGLIISSALFAYAHDSDTLIGYLPYFYAALIFGLVYLKTKRLEVAILAHFLNNFLSLF